MSCRTDYVGRSEYIRIESMTEIAFITATPPSINSGMLLCEATARAFAQFHLQERGSKFYRIYQIVDCLQNLAGDDRKIILEKCDTGVAFKTLHSLSELADV